MSGGSFIIGHGCAGYCGFTALRAVDNVEFHIVADIVERYFKVYFFFIRTHGHVALIGQIKHTVAVVIHIRNGAFKLHKVAFHKLAHIEVVNFIYGERYSQNGYRAQIHDQRVFADRYGYRSALLDYKAVARYHIAVAFAAEGYAIGEGYLNHKAAVVDVLFVQSGVYAQIHLYFRGAGACGAGVADRPNKLIAQIFQNVFGQEGSDYLNHVVVAAFKAYLQSRLHGKSVGENGRNAFHKVGAVKQAYLLVLSRDFGLLRRVGQRERAFYIVSRAVVHRSVLIYADGEVCAALEEVEIGYARVHKRDGAAAREGSDEIGQYVARHVQGDEVALYGERGEQHSYGIHYISGSGRGYGTGCYHLAVLIVSLDGYGVIGVTVAPHNVGVHFVICGHGGLPQQAVGIGHSDHVSYRAGHGLPSSGVGGFTQRYFHARNAHLTLNGRDIRVSVRTVHANGERSRLARKVYGSGISECGGVISRARKIGYRSTRRVHERVSFRRAEGIFCLPREGDRVYRLIVGGCLHRRICVGFSQSVEHRLFGSADLTADGVQFGIYLYEVGVCGGHVCGVYAGSFVKGETGSVRRARIEQQGTLFFIYTIYLIIYAACRAVLVPYQFDFVLDRVSPEIQIAGEVNQSAQQVAQRQVFRKTGKQIHKHSVQTGIGNDILSESEVAKVDIEVVLFVKQYLRNNLVCVSYAQLYYLSCRAVILPQLYFKGYGCLVGAYAQIYGTKQRLYVRAHIGDKTDDFADKPGYARIRVGQSYGKFQRAVEQLIEQSVKKRVVGVLPTGSFKIFFYLRLDIDLNVSAYLPIVCKVKTQRDCQAGASARFGSEDVARNACAERAVVFKLDIYNGFALQKLTCVKVHV